MALLSYHSGRRGFLGFLTYITGSDSVSRGGVVPAFVSVDSTGVEIPSPGLQLPASLGPKAGSASLSVVPATNSRYVVANTAGQSAGSPTYRASGVGYTAYATPTDLITITGSASKTVIVTSISIQIQTTAAALQTLYFVKRSTANTGGTASQPTTFPLDSTNGAATAVVNLYSAAPTTGALVGNVVISQSSSSVLTAAGAAVVNGTASSLTDLRQGIILRGTGEVFALNYNGAALTSGFTATWYVEWIEV